MAETANDVIAAGDVPEKEVATATDPESTTAEAQVVEKMETDAAEDVKPAVAEDATTTNGSEDTTKAPAKDAKDDQKDADDKTTEENTRKRKDPPVSVSAHDRYENKRGRGGRGGRGGGFGNHSKVKTRFEEQPESSDPEEIRRQVEFYFSDSNLPIDAYLLSETGGHANRPVPLKVIHNFKRMRHFQPFQAVRDAVAESKFLILDDKDEITRKKPLDGKFSDDPQHNRSLVHTASMVRSIYAKGFGDEKATTALDIEAFFEPYGPLNAVRLRRHDDGEFKGSVFVEFADEAGQTQFLELEAKPQWDGKDLEIMSKQEYVDMKHQGIMDGTVKPRSPSGRNFNDRERRGGGHRGDRGDRRGGGKREWVDKDDWKNRRDHDNARDGDRGRGRGGRDRGRGRGDKRGRGGRGDGGRRRSPDFRDRERKGDHKGMDREENGDRAGKSQGDAGAGAQEADTVKAKAATADVKSNGDASAVAKGGADAPPAGAAKKRAREDDAGAAEPKTNGAAVYSGLVEVGDSDSDGAGGGGVRLDGKMGEEGIMGGHVKFRVLGRGKESVKHGVKGDHGEEGAKENGGEEVKEQVKEQAEDAIERDAKDAVKVDSADE
ncbi:hypothetical protein LTR53_001381 [Teratosphaeriaceae sp. CCFEE 6253]|nr:hypothetical protein LTR53_001381 [Teratosphaeriaceae sp. CCFEE 6253]